MQAYSLAIAAVIGFGGVYVATQLAARPAVVERSDQEIKLQARQMSYHPLAREPAKYTGTLVVLRGKVVQVVEDGDDVLLRVNITQGAYDWTDTVGVSYRKKFATQARISETDIVRFWGRFVGIESDEAVSGATTEIPHVVAQVVETARKM